MSKACFCGNPTAQIDPHQQITGLGADQMIQFVRVIGLEVFLATFGMLEDLLMKTISKNGRTGGASENISMQSPFLSRAVSTIAESVAPRFFQSLPTIIESIASNLMLDLQN